MSHQQPPNSHQVGQTPKYMNNGGHGGAQSLAGLNYNSNHHQI